MVKDNYKDSFNDKDKIRDILNRHYGHKVMAGSDLWFTEQYQDRFAHLLEMAEWKEKQMIEKACEWWENELTYPTMSQVEIDLCQTKIVKFKKAMEECKI